MDITEDDIRFRLTNQSPRTAAIGAALDALTFVAIEYGRVLAKLPPGHDKSLAVTHLEDSLARAKKAVALNQEAIDPEAAPDA